MKSIIVCLLLLATCSSVTENSDTFFITQRQKPMTLNSQDNSWIPIYFEEINERARLANLPDLNKTSSPRDDLEIRVWNGFGVTALEGFVLKRSAGRWSAIHLDGIHPKLPQSQYQTWLKPPKSGWDRCWERLVDAGLLTLPDASQLGNESETVDGMSYVVEYKVNGSYRTYKYSNPQYNDRKEAKQMLEISNIIFEEFGVIEFKTR